MSEKKTTVEKEVKEMNIYQRLAAITNELQTVAKNLEVSTGKSSYKAVSERDILDAVKPLENKYGVYSYPVSRDVMESNLLESVKEYTDKGGNTTVTKSSTFMSRIKTIYRFVNVDNPDEYVETITFAEGIDAQDKGSGKAMTYADKYALMKGYKISTGEDPDQTGSEETKYSKKSDTFHKCVDCGKEIVSTPTNRGELWTADDIAGYSLKRYGRKLCPVCQKKAAESQ